MEQLRLTPHFLATRIWSTIQSGLEKSYVAGPAQGVLQFIGWQI
ncbi:MAG: hypothetical protein VB051_05610 [Candidatus Pelethousia sp.]|nr:hypothetical protein [Candidatus Pelethousia sp.]